MWKKKKDASIVKNRRAVYMCVWKMTIHMSRIRDICVVMYIYMYIYMYVYQVFQNFKQRKCHVYVTYASSFWRERIKSFDSFMSHTYDSGHINQVLEMRRLLAHHKYTRVNFSPHHTQMVQDSQTKHPQEQTLHSPYTKFYGGQFLFFSCYTCAWVTSHVCMSHVTSIKKSWYSCERVMSHMWTGLLTTHMNESCLTYELCHIYERVMSHIWVVPYIWTSHVTHMSHATHMNEPCYAYETRHIYERVMSHIWVLPHTWTSQVTHMGYATHMNESCQRAPVGWLRLVGILKL